VYSPWALSKSTPTLLIVDELAGHMTKEVRDAIASCGAFIEYIPGGYICCFQVIDVGVNQPFKNRIRIAYDNFRIANDCVSKPKREDVSGWVREAWNNIRETTIINT
jgi:hypothetical protein